MQATKETRFQFPRIEAKLNTSFEKSEDDGEDADNIVNDVSSRHTRVMSMSESSDQFSTMTKKRMTTRGS